MGFRTGSYATVWGVESKSNTFAKVRISISHKDKQSGEYVTDFSGFAGFCGTSTAAKALTLKEKDRIKLGDVDVKSVFNKEKNVTYYNFYVYSFEDAEYGASRTNSTQVNSTQPAVDDGEVDDSGRDLPF
jgi:hypothetical protein